VLLQEIEIDSKRSLGLHQLQYERLAGKRLILGICLKALERTVEFRGLSTTVSVREAAFFANWEICALRGELFNCITKGDEVLNCNASELV